MLPSLIKMEVLVLWSATSAAGWEIGAEGVWASRYYWRGMNWSEGSVLQTSLWLTYRSSTLLLWGNLPLSTLPQTAWDETDLYLSSSHPLTNTLALETLLAHYRYPHSSDPATSEAELALFWAKNPVSARLSLTKDVQTYPANLFLTGQWGWVREMKSGWGEWGFELGWGNRPFRESYLSPLPPHPPQAGLHHLTLQALRGFIFNDYSSSSIKAEWSFLFYPPAQSLSHYIKKSAFILSIAITSQRPL